MDNNLLIPTALSAFKRHKLVVMAAFVSALAGSIAYLLLTPDTYVSSARIMLNESEANISDLGRSLTQLDSPGAGSDPLATQSELITSEAVYAQSLEILESDDVGGALTANYLDENLKVRVIPATNILELNFSHNDPEVAANVLNAVVQSVAEINGENIRKQASQVRVFLEDQLLDQEARLKEAEDSERRFRQESGIVAFDDQVRSLVDSISRLEGEERQLIAQLEALRERADLLQNITGADAVQDAYESVRIGQDEILNDLRGRLVDLEASIAESSSRLGAENPELLALFEERESLQTLYQQQIEQGHGGTRVNPNEYLSVSPSSQDLMNQLIATEVEYGSLRERLLVVQSEMDTLQNRLVEVPALSQPLVALTRQRDTAEEALRNLRTNLEEARIAEAQIVSNINILGEASIPASPAAPNKPAVLFLGVVTGLVLSSGLLILLEAMDSTLHGSEDAKAWIKYPIVGELPPYENALNGNLQVLEDSLSESNFVAPYHSLISALQHYLAFYLDQGTAELEANAISSSFFKFGSPDVRSKTILVSSAFWGEGKSQILRHVAAVNAMLGSRTLLIDADLLSGNQTAFFNLIDTNGLSDVIAARENFFDACHMTQIENLSVLPKGHTAGQPVTVVDSSSMEAVIEKAAAHYDCIIVDIPPITESPACISLSQYVGGLFLVVRPNFKSKYDLRSATAEFVQSGGKLFGQIINRENSRESEIIPFPTPALDKVSSNSSSTSLFG